MRKTRWMASLFCAAVLVSRPFSAWAAAPGTSYQGNWAFDGEAEPGTGPSLEGGAADAGADAVYTKEQLEDLVLEYGEIGARIQGYNTDYKNLNTQLISSTLNYPAARELTQEANRRMEDAWDLWDSEMDDETRAEFNSYKKAAQSLRRQAQELTNEELSGTYQRTLRQTKNRLEKTVQSLLCQHQQLVSSAAAAEKSVELLTEQVRFAQSQLACGQGAYEDVLAAQKRLESARSGAAQLESARQNLRQSILLLLGWDSDTPVEFAPVPQPDAGRIGQMDLEADIQAAVWANYDLAGIKQTSASGTAERTVKKRSIDVTEQTVRVQMGALYQQVISRQEAYEGAAAAYEAAARTMQAAEKKKALGMLGSLEYLQAQQAWAQAEADFDSASLAFFQALEDYDWAVKGLITADGG